MKPLLTPGICLVAVAVLLHTGLVTPSVTLITYAFYTAAIAGLLLAWRFHSSRIFFALLVAFLAQEAISYFSICCRIIYFSTRPSRQPGKHRTRRRGPALAA
jgi:Na+/phosphate symporter